MTIEPVAKILPDSHPRLHYLTLEPATPPIARLIILHGYGEHSGRYSHFMQWLTERGIACFAMDFRGQGQSEGVYGFVRHWNDYLTDLAAFLALPDLSAGGSPLFVLGHSHGALIAAAAVIRGQLNQCQGIILCSPYMELKMPVPLRKRMIARAVSAFYPSMPMRSGTRGSMLTRDPGMLEQTENDPLCKKLATPRWFFEAIKAQKKIRSRAGEFKHPLLMLIAGDDTLAQPLASVDFFHHIGSADKTMVQYPDHRHELLREIGREAIFQTIFEWIQTRLAS